MNSYYEIKNCDNRTNPQYPLEPDIIFADFVYEDKDFNWTDYWWNKLQDGGLFIAMTDFHTVFEYGVYMKGLDSSILLNHLCWKNEWGNHPKDRFHQCFDDILIFSKGRHKFFNSDAVQVPKKTAKTKLNPSGRETKTATAFIDDICLTTTSKERVVKPDGHLIRWQKPVALINRILAPFTAESSVIYDIFMGSGTVGEWCIRNNRNYFGIEYDPEVFSLAKTRLDNVVKELEK